MFVHDGQVNCLQVLDPISRPDELVEGHSGGSQGDGYKFIIDYDSTLEVAVALVTSQFGECASGGVDLKQSLVCNEENSSAAHGSVAADDKLPRVYGLILGELEEVRVGGVAAICILL